ncbi:MAG: hypothetical protein FJZ00_01215 [Candidatus Sericytochromatia bacterium]|uniref:Uncharacterized protein n=1 Tax=Candidatus Tanganyikabacteria bacterium TaxID=2961651 RepID=A0A937X0L7_9BACT|nr:hypothetical protein [Candidatus Tanganyikabacteria bacterium]
MVGSRLLVLGAVAVVATGSPAGAQSGGLPGRPGHTEGQAAPAGPNPRSLAALRQVQTWIDGTEGRLTDIIPSSTITPPEILSDPDGGRRLVFKVVVNFNRGFYDRYGQWQREWADDGLDAGTQGRIRKQLSRLNRYGIFLGLYSGDGDLIAKAPVVKNPYFANMLEDYYENREGNLVPVPHSQVFRDDRPETIEPMLRRGDLGDIASLPVFERFQPVFKAEIITKRDVVLQVAAEDLSNAKTYRLVMESTAR